MYKKFIKRPADLIAASVLLIILSPTLLAVALLIRMVDGKPIIFKQVRFGKNKKPFMVYKFRTMNNNAPKDCPTNDLSGYKSHITGLGRILRKLSIDELPQLLNVIKGEMSVVGPRPVILKETALIDLRDQYGANCCAPGITGWAQVNGRDELEIERKAQMDGEYASSFGLFTDVKCILMTAWAVVSTKGNKEGLCEACKIAATDTKKVLFTSHTANFHKFNRPFMRMLSGEGYKVHYASAGEEDVKDCDNHFDVPFERSPFKLNNLKSIFLLKKIIDEEKYDIIHTHTPMGSVVTRLAAIRSKKKNRTKIIYTAHGFHFYKGAPLLNWLIYYPIEKIMARFTDILITINKEDFERAKKKFRTDVRYVPGVGVDPKKFGKKMSKVEKKKLRKSLGLKQDDFVMIYPAELNKNKNQKFLIEAMEYLVKDHPDIHLLLPGQDSMNGYHERLIKEKDLSENVHLLGYRRDIPDLMRISDLAVSASKREGLPINIIEAVMSRLPVVATNCRGNADLIGVSTDCVVELDNVGDLVGSIFRLYGSKPGHIEFILDKNFEHVEKNHSQEAVMSGMKDIYEAGKLKVLHLLYSSSFSGAENVACGIINSTKDRFESIYCSPFGSIGNALDKKGIRYWGVDKFSYREVRKIIKALKPDIVHAHDFRASILASFVGRGAEIISHIHQNPLWINKICLRFIAYRVVMASFGKIVIVDPLIQMAKIFDNKYRHAVSLLQNSVDPKLVRERSRQSISDSYDMCFCARLEDVKQPLDFIKIVHIVSSTQKNIRAVMVGDGTLRGQCEDMIIKLGLQKNINLVGFTSNPYKYIGNSKFLILTSKSEGLPLVILEAMALETVVLSYNVGGVGCALGDGLRGGLANNVQGIVDLYEEFNSSPEKYNFFIREVAEYLDNNLSNYSSNLDELYKFGQKGR